ncbi:hypothetical protein [Halobacterium bonnevillei]|uniref:Uncharacterized protein n=1 Tax=Halobacterium bonnevillei TaxID=2692200 RepID=A0A6B0SDF3_9EURY|nr:hypothetical protein [Halobacterium bonnevillei]MXR19754.1 hypothetical protein [Halobacterium bonnevillei]
MRQLALSVVAALVVVAGVAAPAAAAGPQPTAPDLGVSVAQSAHENQTTTEPVGKQIDSTISLVSSSYDPDSGTVTLVFESAASRRVTLSDAGGFLEGGEVNRRTITVDGRTAAEFAVTETDRGYVGVSISTDQVLYAEIVRSPSLSPFRGSSGTVGWFGGAAIVILSFVGAALWKLYKEGGEPVEAAA